MAELGVTDAAAYFGYSAPDDADPGDPAAWYGCMPALGITVSEETVRADFATMPLAEFRRAYLCQWPEIAKPGWDVISQQAWAAAAGGMAWVRARWVQRSARTGRGARWRRRGGGPWAG